MKAELLFHERIDYDDGSIVDLAHSVTGPSHNSRLEILIVLWATGCSGRGL
jgi:hypothetical protein